ncbi:MAG: LTA synthase family protein, partial [Bacteroidales bacterium]|nr:LTA synthase family protein [Bacteroidales bacterium]
MKERLIELVKTYLLLLGIFVLQKPLFMLCYHALYADVPCTDWVRVIWHGLVLDTSVAAYFTVVPGLLAVISAWSRTGILHWIYRGYYLLVSLLLALIFVVDVSLYGYWGFRLDATPVFYFLSSPQDAVASVSGGYIALGLLAVLAYAALLYGLFYAVLLRKRVWHMPATRSPLLVSFVLLVLTGALFIPIRGGFSVASMNTGHVYFSTDQRLNHAAINPAFSLVESLSKQKNFAAQYRFMPADEAARRMRGLIDPA